MLRSLSSPRVTIMAMRAMQVRALSSPGADPLKLMLGESIKWKLCDDAGYRLPNVHWTFSVAVASDDPSKAPLLRTIGIQRISENGIDFVVKKYSASCNSFGRASPVSVLQLKGRHVIGEVVEQWRGEGQCKTIPLSEVIDVIPNYTINAMLSTRRLAEEVALKSTDDDRFTIVDNSHVHEVVQSTRADMDEKRVDKEELEKAICAYRFRPDRMERMTGGPETVIWDRWEWQRSVAGTWDSPTHMMPH